MNNVTIYSAQSQTFVKLPINNYEKIEENYDYYQLISKIKENQNLKNNPSQENELIFIHLHNNPEIFESTLKFLDICPGLSSNQTENINSNRTEEMYKIILDGNKLDLDYILPIDQNSFFLNINVIQSKNMNRRDFTSRRDKIVFKSNKFSDNDLLSKKPIQLFILGKIYFILSGGENSLNQIDAVSALDDLILYIFTEKFKFSHTKNLDEFLNSNFINEKSLTNNIQEESYQPCIKLLGLKTQTNFLNRVKTWNTNQNFLNFELTSFHQYELDTRTKSSKNLIKKLQILLQEEKEEQQDHLNLNNLDNSNRSISTSNFNFKLEKLLYWLFLSSLENFSKISDYMNRECEELKETYLHLQKSFEKKMFYSRMSRLEETMHLVSQELKIKVEFFSEIIKKLNKKENNIVKILCLNLKAGENIKFSKNLKLYLEQMIGKLRETKFIIKNLETSLQMIKKTFRIIIDDNQRMADEKSNKYMMYLTIITALLTPFTVICQSFSMNIIFPMDKQKYGLVPFFIIVGCALIVVIGQSVILTCWKKKKLN
jgi:Mg2+ and Co2+ transporter CorA